MDKIIYFDKFNKIKEKEYKKLYSFLPLSRKKQIDKINDINTKKIKIIEYYLIKKYLKLKENTDFCYSKNGKPYIENKKHFSISHTKNALVIAISKENVGIDMEEIKKHKTNLIKKVCNEKEIEEIKNSKNKTKKFLEIWTKKESTVKLFDTSIFFNTKDILTNTDAVRYRTFFKNNHIITIAKLNKKFKKWQNIGFMNKRYMIW